MENRMEHTHADGLGNTLENIGMHVLRYGLVIVLFWVGLLKFTAYEAEGIQGLLANSPFFSWMLGVMSVRTASSVIGFVEVVTAILIATRAFAPKVSAIGSMLAIVTFLITLTFVFTTPGVWQPGYGFPYPSPMPGQFIAKDVILLGASIWTAGEALRVAGWRKV